MTAISRTRRGLLAFVLVFAMLASLGGGLPAAAAPGDAPNSYTPQANDMRISQVYGGGGGSGYYLYDYVELFNAGASAVDISGWSLQYGSSTGNFASTATNLYAFPAGTTVTAGKYLLVQLGSAGTSGVALPVTPDLVTTNLSMAQGSGKVALANVATALACGATATLCVLPDSRIVDLVSYGASNNAEGGVTVNNGTALTNQQGSVRKSAGCQDTDHNGNDFDVVSGASLTPRNSSSPANNCTVVDDPPTVTSTTPTDGATDVPVDTAITMQFSESVDVTANAFTVECPVGAPVTFNSTPALPAAGVTSVVLSPDADLPYDTTCTVTVAATEVTDTDDTPQNMAQDYIFTFTTIVGDVCSLAFTPIYDIQGNGPATPIPGPVTTQGVVVGDFEGPSPALRGFYLQDLTGDGDPATSDGVFVFNSSNNSVSVGDVVRVAGTAEEFQDQTQITSVTSIFPCGTGSVSPVDITLPFPSADYLERYEGMLVRLPQTLYVTEHFQLGRFGQVVLTSRPDRLQQPTNVVLPGAAANALQAANNLDRIILDDDLNNQNPDPIVFGRGGNPLSAANTLRGGDSAAGIAGVLTYTWAGNAASGNAFRVRPIGALNGGMIDFQPTNPRPGDPSVSGRLQVTAANVLNYFNTFGAGNCTLGVGGAPTNCRGADNLDEFNRQWPKIVAMLVESGADVIGLMEIENDGYDPTSAIAQLVDQMNDATSAGTYAFIDADAATGQVNSLGNDAIKVGLIYKPASVTPVGSTAALNTVSFVTGGDSADRNRPALAQAFEEAGTGDRFIVVVNHLKSKGSACDAPDAGDGQGNCNIVRLNAATEMVAWLATDPTGTGDPDILIMGDLNSYAKEDPIAAIEGAGYTNLISDLVGQDAYSYAFDGQWGYLDHALASLALSGQVSSVEEWHINSDEPSVLDYNTNFKSAGQLVSLYAPDRFRSSDHDPVLIGLDLFTADPSIVITKTVGTDAGVCATTNDITVAAGSAVYYCYEVANTGNLTLNLHDLADSELGPIFSGFNYALTPGSSVDTVAAGLTISATIDATTVNTALWTAYNVGPIDVVTATATATVTVLIQPPNIFVDPLSISSSQDPDVQTQHTLTISNTGGSPLNWQIFDQPTVIAGPASPLPLLPFEAVLADEMEGIERRAPAAIETPDPAARALAKRALLTTGLLLVPDSTSDRIMALDPITGNVIDPNFVPNTPAVGTGINAILSAGGDSILLSDQTGDVVHEFDLDGNYLGIFAPAGGVNTAILDNMRGISLRPNGNLLVTVAGGANTNAVAEFDTGGNYLGNFIANAAGGLGSPWDPFGRSSDWLVSGSAGTTGLLRYDLAGAFLNVFAPISTFPEQIAEAGNGNVLVANFSPSSNQGVLEYTAAGVFVGRYAPTELGGYRGVYELPGGTILTTTGAGVHEIDRSGNLVESKITGISGRFIEYVAPPITCSTPAEIPWASVIPSSGTIAAGSATTLTVTLDSTGLAPGVYTGNLCIESDDPDAGPGNETDLVIVPLELTVEIPTAVTLSSIGASQMPLPAAGLPLAALPAAIGLALGAAYALRRRQ